MSIERGNYRLRVEAQESPREAIDRWLVVDDPDPLGKLRLRFNAAVRASLAAFDEDHPWRGVYLAGSECKCHMPMPCPTRARHEQALARAIGVSE